MQNIKIKIADYFIVALLLAAGLAGFWFNVQQSSAAQHKYVELFVDNRKVDEISMAEDYIYKFAFGPQGEHEGILEIADGKVRMLPMGSDLCPKGICSHTGWITHSYESIVCLPNRIMVIFSEGSSSLDDEIDGVTY